MTAPEYTARDVRLAEYGALKAEQTSRIALRDRLMYAPLAATLALVLQPTRRPYLLLLLPLVCVVPGWTYFSNDQKISAIGKYLRRHLAPALEAPDGLASAVLAWETIHRRGRLRRLDKSTQMVVDLLMFSIPSLLSTVLYCASGGLRADLFTVSIIEVLATLGFATHVVAGPDVSAREQDPSQR